VVHLLEDAASFLGTLRDGTLLDVAMAGTSRPVLLSLSEPCSWLADRYNTATTNSSHNPLCEPTRLWLARQTEYKWFGWPKSRSVAIGAVVQGVTERRQWQFIGLDASKRRLLLAEVKSITANNWGNKSKELYDRSQTSKKVAQEAGYSCKCVGVLDGDFGHDQLSELATGIAYDEAYAIQDVLGEVYP